MAPTYESLEDGQIIKSAEVREDLEALARWKRRGDDEDDSTSTEIVPPSSTPVAGELNTEPVTGGVPPLTSTTAGIANPADTLSHEEAAERAAAALADSAPPPLKEQVGPQDGLKTGDTAVDGSTDAGTTDAGTDKGDGGLDRPGLNGSTEEWLAYVRQPSVGVEVADDATRTDIVDAYIAKFAPAGNASSEAWADYAREHGVESDGDRRGEIREAVIAAGWAKA
jgi:hypothetical protein